MKSIILLLIAVTCAAIGLLQPSHYRSLDPEAIEHAAKRSDSNERLISQALDAAQPGPARLLIEGTGSTADEPMRRIEALIKSDPKLGISGGTVALFDRFLDASTNPTGGSAAPSSAAISLILPRFERSVLLEQLSASRNTNVQSVLMTRETEGLTRLHPATHAAGAPYESGLLTIALLIEGEHFSPSLSSEIGTNARTALDGSTEAFEAFVIATLSLAQRLDFRSLANLAKLPGSPSDWSDMATMLRAYPDSVPQLYTALTMEESPERLLSFLTDQPMDGIDDVKFALRFGKGSLDYLLEHKLAITEPSPAMVSLAPLLEFRPELFTILAVENRNLSLALKFLSFLFAGLLIAIATAPLLFRRASSKTPAARAQNLFVSLVAAIYIWMIVEPEILQSKSNEDHSAPRIEFNVASTLDSLKTPVNAMQDLNQVTLLVLALFFIIQLMIYCFCIIKLREISRQSVPSETKIQLLENEENLFDFGLYVGLGGTVLSLILVAVGIVEASLMAAYASTLFGIIFVALFKILHLRPLRRELILQQSPSPASVPESTDS